MASTLFVDDNNRVLSHPGGLRPNGKAAGIVTVTMSGSVQELTLPGGGASQRGQAIYRLIGIGQAVLYAIDKAGQGASYGDNTKMVFLPSNVIEYFRADPTDVSFYVVQGGAAGTVQVCVMT